MYPKLFHIYGPLELNSFNLAIALGIFVFLKFTTKNLTSKYKISKEEFLNLTIETAIFAIIGGRLLHVLSDLKSYTTLTEILSIWNGGLSILGAIPLAIVYAIYFLKKRNIPILPILDLSAIYAPLIHSIARVGCFLTGCCHGAKTSAFWAITYTNKDISAPLFTPLHPTQLYSSIFFFGIFLFMRYFLKNRLNIPGQLFMCYLILSSTERIIVDFFRGDRIFSFNKSIKFFEFFSFYQIIGLAILSSALIGLISISSFRKKIVKLT